MLVVGNLDIFLFDFMSNIPTESTTKLFHISVRHKKFVILSADSSEVFRGSVSSGEWV